MLGEISSFIPLSLSHNFVHPYSACFPLLVESKKLTMMMMSMIVIKSSHPIKRLGCLTCGTLIEPEND